jgi:hypothetical protein
MEFSTGSAVRFGWETFKKRPWFFVGASVLIAIAYIIVGSITSAIDYTLTGSAEETSLPGSLINWIFGTLIGMGVTAFYLKAHDDPATVDLPALWHPRPFWYYLAGSILVGLAIIAGLILLVIPGIIFGLMFMFTTFIIIDRGIGPIEAMKESNRITRGHRWTLLGLILVLFLINLAGALALVVGLLVSIPVSTLAFTHAYRVLTAMAPAVALPPPGPASADAKL